MFKSRGGIYPPFIYLTYINNMLKWEDSLRNYRNMKKFDNNAVCDWVRLKVNKFNEYLGKHNLCGAVLSVSGGIDSAVTLGLLQRTKALPNSNLKKILAINQPIHSSDWAYRRAKELCEKFKIELTVIDQTEIFDNLVNVIEKNTGIKSDKFSTYINSLLADPSPHIIGDLFCFFAK